MTEPSRPVRTILREMNEDGGVLETEYLAARIRTEEDPFVLTRLVPQGKGAGSEIITEFAPAPARPASYPPALPFIANRSVWTTESPAGTGLQGARWPTVDVDTLRAAIVEASIADGWSVIPHPAPGTLLGTPDIVLERDNTFRELQIVRLSGNGIVQLWDVPATWFDPRPA